MTHILECCNKKYKNKNQWKTKKPQELQYLTWHVGVTNTMHMYEKQQSIYTLNILHYFMANAPYNIGFT
jgi:hypothetical protein